MICKVHWTDGEGKQQEVEFEGAAEHHVESFVFALIGRGCTKVKVVVTGF